MTNFSAQAKDKFLTDLRKSQEIRDPKELNEFLDKMRMRLDDPDVLTRETLHRLLLSYRFWIFELEKLEFRDNQNYDAMISLIDELSRIKNTNVVDFTHIRYLYAFALTRYCSFFKTNTW